VPILNAALASRNIDKLEAALRQAETVGFEMFAIKQAQRMVHVFKEEKRLESVYKVLLNQPVHEYYNQFRETVATADDIGSQSKLGMLSPFLFSVCESFFFSMILNRVVLCRVAAANEIRAKFAKAKAERDAIEAQGREAIKTMKADELKATLEKATSALRFALCGGCLCCGLNIGLGLGWVAQRFGSMKAKCSPKSKSCCSTPPKVPALTLCFRLTACASPHLCLALCVCCRGVCEAAAEGGHSTAGQAAHHQIHHSTQRPVLRADGRYAYPLLPLLLLCMSCVLISIFECI
jgi:hypothetical protein